MLRIVTAALVAVSIAAPASAQVGSETAVPQGLLKSWTGAVCNGNLQITYTFTAIKGNRLAGSYRDSSSLAINFDPDGPSPIRASVSGNTLTIQIQAKQTMILNYADGVLAGEYIRDADHWTPAEWKCPRRAPVRFR